MLFLSRSSAAFWGLLDPWMFLGTAAACLPHAIAALIQDRGLGATLPVLLRPRALQDAWFGYFWGRVAAPGIREGAEPRVVALLEGRTVAGRVVDEGDLGEEERGPPVAGVVLEVGAGSGLWVDVFPRFVAQEETGSGDVRRRRGATGGVTRVYGVEPSRDQHANLRRAITRAGLDDVYRIAPVGVEGLEHFRDDDGSGGIEKGSVDCIVTILCLCSIPDPGVNVRELYGYLKEGGRWYAYEHVRCEHSWYMRLYQRFINVFWPHFLGGCQLCRQTEKTLREAGPWTKINVGQPPDEPWFHSVPHILGVFTK
ncbi:S-adenosyl-L-methionine-dependent methyltransferase [Hypoxylon sp. FL1284]|nr:S-adenosyl-L-methionine-dependent methyltransferase [Hypoxylon sp. FL1284]